MSSDTEGWRYASANTVPGALQRGLGRGAVQVASAPDAAELVSACLRRDYRWDWQVDERYVYLARLVRDLGMPIAPIAARLQDAPPRSSDDDNAFTVGLGVLDVLGHAGFEEAVDEVRGYIRDGSRWLDALETVAGTWPVAWWNDLYPAVANRIGGLTEHEALWLSPPWTVWADRDDRIATACAAAQRHRPPRPRPLAAAPTETLLALLRDTGRQADWAPALRELRRRPPEPELLGLAEHLAHHRTAGPVDGVVADMGPLALPAARRWAATADHPLAWTSLRLLAAHGDTTDAPALVTGLDRLDARPGYRCGYDDLATGLARIGGPTAAAAAPRLHRLWFSPHSCERAAYLRALIALDPAGTQRKIVEGLWDCEAGVRLLAVRHAPMDDRIRERLRYLRDDPMETAEVRAAAGERMTTDLRPAAAAQAQVGSETAPH